jgi:hypothetical protein
LLAQCLDELGRHLGVKRLRRTTRWGILVRRDRATSGGTGCRTTHGPLVDPLLGGALLDALTLEIGIARLARQSTRLDLE